jgi:ribosomal protein S18 acetylase RimI-like enzyme
MTKLLGSRIGARLVRIRAAIPNDSPEIDRIARASFDRVYAYFARRGRRHADVVLIAEDDSSVLGFLEGNVFDGDPPIGYVYFVATEPAHRGKGVARTLVAESLREFAHRRATRVFAAVTRGNEPSEALFASMGFERIPRRRLWTWYRWRGLLLPQRMLLAPHEVLYARTFADLP